MPRYTALEPIEHDGKRSEPGAALTLTKEQAAPLLALRHIEPEDKAPSAASQTPAATGEQPA